MKRKDYVKPYTGKITVDVENLLTITSWSPDGGDTRMDIIEGNPDDAEQYDPSTSDNKNSDLEVSSTMMWEGL